MENYVQFSSLTCLPLSFGRQLTRPCSKETFSGTSSYAPGVDVIDFRLTILETFLPDDPVDLQKVMLLPKSSTLWISPLLRSYATFISYRVYYK